MIGNMSFYPKTIPEKKKRVREILALLSPLYPDHTPLLVFANPFELLVATVLAAQCTDAAVNQVSPALFGLFPGPARLAEAPLDVLEKILYPTGFYRTKARNIKALSARLCESYGGEVPRTMEELSSLPGVGRKTASVVLSVSFGFPAIIVDTHFKRAAKRLGLVETETPEKVERDIARITETEDWIAVSHVLNRHGRKVCRARKPACEACAVLKLCPGAAS